MLARSYVVLLVVHGLAAPGNGASKTLESEAALTWSAPDSTPSDRGGDAFIADAFEPCETEDLAKSNHRPGPEPAVFEADDRSKTSPPVRSLRFITDAAPIHTLVSAGQQRGPPLHA
jgi:hypothetical protein